MQLTAQDAMSSWRPATVNKNFSLQGEWVRKFTFEDGDTLVTVEVIAYISGIRAQRMPDGTVVLRDQVSRFDVLGKNQYMQAVERAVFIWRRLRPGPDGDIIEEEDIDYSNEIGLFYQDSEEKAFHNAKRWLDDFDPEVSLEPEAWEVPVNG